jgi:hypothetical protein
MPRLIGFDADTLRPLGPADIARREQIAKRMRRLALIRRLWGECEDMAYEYAVCLAIALPAACGVIWWMAETL